MLHVIAALEGREGVRKAEPDAESKTVRVRYDPAKAAAAELLDVVNRADLRLQAHHRLRTWLGLRRKTKRLAQLISDDPE